MYGKIFDSMYTGTLYGHWEAIVTFQQMIVLADADGVIDITPAAISARTSIPLEIITKGIEVLEAPDEHTRTPGHEGRRLERLDAHRPWGWHIVNHEKYKLLIDADTVREQNRERQRRHRAVKAVNTPSRSVTPSNASNASSRHTDTDTDTDTPKVNNTVGLKPDIKALRKAAIETLAFLNEKTGRTYQPVPANIDMIVARLKEGATPGDCRAVVEKKCLAWSKDDKMAPYLRPATLFNRTKFAQYRGELGAKSAAGSGGQGTCGNCAKPLTGGWTMSPKGRVCPRCHDGYMGSGWPAPALELRP